MVKLKLLLCLPVLFFSRLQGMKHTEINTTQLILAMQYGLDINKKDSDKYIVNYFKSTCPENSAQEMRITTKVVIENLTQNTKLLADTSYIKLYPNEELNKQNENSSLPHLLFMRKNKTWERSSQLANSS